jgi:uncharacterized Rmd1/YagE family protein
MYRNVLYVTRSNRYKEIFFFPNGCFVCWGLLHTEEKEIIDLVKEFSDRPLEKIEKDFFIYQLGEYTKIYTHDRFNVDIIVLESDSPQVKLAISYGLSQSIKLASYEETIKKTTQENERVPEQLAHRGKIYLGRRAIVKRMGEIFLERSSIILSSEYLDSPEYFWEYPNLENYYIMTEKYLDLRRRVSALNHKLDVLHDTFDMLMSQLQHRRASMLETIIIILIAAEIIINMFHFNRWF